MSYDSIKLTDAIAGNRAWLERAARRYSDLCRDGQALLRQAHELDREMRARHTMAEAMEAVQNLMPENETLNFIVPRD